MHNVRTNKGGGICQRWGVSPQCCRLRGRGSKGRGNRNPCPFVPSLRYFLCIKKVVKKDYRDFICADLFVLQRGAEDVAKRRRGSE